MDIKAFFDLSVNNYFCGLLCIMHDSRIIHVAPMRIIM